MNFFHIHSHPGRAAGLVLSWFLFAAGIVSYFYVAQARHRDNPDDRVMPTVTQMVRAFQDAALKPAEEEEVREGAESQPLITGSRASVLWKDTMATSRRFLVSIALLFPPALLVLHMAMCPYIGPLSLQFFQFFEKTVALSVLPTIV